MTETILIIWLWLWGALGFFACDEKLEKGSGRLWRNALWPILMPVAAVVGLVQAIAPFTKRGVQ